MVKAHPGYSGTIMTATFQIARELGWEYLEKLAKQKVMQVQSAADPPKKLALGERAVMADGNEYNMFQEKEAGRPVEIVYPSEGTPLIVGPNAHVQGVRRTRTRRGCSRAYCYTAECQQLLIDVGGLRSVHPQTKEKPGRTPFARSRDEGRRGRRREVGRGDQEALQPDFGCDERIVNRLMLRSAERASRTSRPPILRDGASSLLRMRADQQGGQQ